MNMSDTSATSHTMRHRNELYNFIRSVFQASALGALESEALWPEMFASLFSLATQDYGVSKKTLGSLLGFESVQALDEWNKPEYAPTLSLRIRATYLIGVLICTTMLLEEQDFSLPELDSPAETSSIN